jgi:hypothetical protein
METGDHVYGELHYPEGAICDCTFDLPAVGDLFGKRYIVKDITFTKLDEDDEARIGVDTIPEVILRKATLAERRAK